MDSRLDDAVLVRCVAGTLLADHPVRGLGDVQYMGEQQLIDALERVREAVPLTVALFSPVLWGSCVATLESLLSRFLRHVVGEASREMVEMLE